MARASAGYENAALAGPIGTAGTTNIIPYYSLHSADPGVTGASEISGGSPAYARQAPGWGAPAAGSMSNGTGMTFNVPALTTVDYSGTWTTLTAGSYGIGAALSSSETFNTQGTLTIAVGAATIAIS